VAYYAVYAQWLAGHEQPHVKQIERIVKLEQVASVLEIAYPQA
jgi:hypothetical protein